MGGVHWQALAHGEFWTPVQGGASANERVSLRALLWTLGASGCGVLGGERFTFPLCGGARGGLVHAQARGVAEPRAVRSPWAEAFAGAGARWWFISQLALGVQLEGHAAILRPSFRTEPSGRTFKARAGGVTALFGLHLRWR